MCIFITGDAIVASGPATIDWSLFNQMLQEQGILEPNSTIHDSTNPDMMAIQKDFEAIVAGDNEVLTKTVAEASAFMRSQQTQQRTAATGASSSQRLGFTDTSASGSSSIRQGSDLLPSSHSRSRWEENSRLSQRLSNTGTSASGSSSIRQDSDLLPSSHSRSRWEENGRLSHRRSNAGTSGMQGNLKICTHLLYPDPTA